MNIARIALFSGALLGFIGVIAGAMGAHALESRLSPSQLDSYETAVRFQMYHALLLLLLGSLFPHFGTHTLGYAVWAILLGTLLFSGSIYLLTLSSVKVGIVTPIGGLILIVGWALIGLWALRVQL